MTDADYARLCQATYSATGLGDDFAMQTAELDGRVTVCFRGTKTWQEWLQDFVAVPLPAAVIDLFASRLFPIETANDARIGPVHAGFLAGTLKLLPAVAAAVRGRPFALTGHSLGGALATVSAAFLAVNGTPPAEVVTFGAPRAGMEPLVAVLQRVAVRQYRYHADPVPWVPTAPPFLHAREPLIQLGHAFGLVLTDHHITHYINALEQGHAPETKVAA